MKNIIVVIILVAIVLCIVRFLYNSKKRGETCIGCPYAKQCMGKCNGGCSGGTSDSNTH